MSTAILVRPDRGDSTPVRMPPWLPLAVVAMAVGTYAYVIGLPRSQYARELQAAIDELSVQHTKLAANADQRATSREKEPTLAPGGNPRSRTINSSELLPAIASLGRQTGVRISSVKQTSSDRQAGESRVHVRAQASFTDIIVLLEEIGGLSPLLMLDDIVLRRTENGAQAGLDVELVVSMTNGTLVKK